MVEDGRAVVRREQLHFLAGEEASSEEREKMANNMRK